MTLKSARTFLFFCAFAVAGFCGVYILISPKFTPPPIANDEFEVASVLNISKGIEPFTLTSTDGKSFTEKNFRGFWTLMFFGYTDCPDVCPMTVATLKQVWQNFPKHRYPAKFVFTSVNPETDTPETLKTFLKNYHQDFIGLTGSPAEVAHIKDIFGIFTGDGTHPITGEKVIDHSPHLMLVDPQGRLKALFTPPFSVASIEKDLTKLINAKYS